NARLLAIVLLLPLLFGAGGPGRRGSSVYSTPDYFIVAYTLLRIALESQNVTQFMRSATVASLDALIPYFVFSRAVASEVDFRKVLLAFVVVLLPLSLIAMFETAKGWLLYGSIFAAWGDPEFSNYLRREGTLRATATASTPIILGFVIMVAIGC